MKEPVDHILRPVLPWRQPEAGAITECGYNASKVQTITREEFFQRRKDLGRQRTAMMTCMTCSDTAGRWGEWGDDPRQALQREIEWEGIRYARANRGHRLRDELVAIAALIDEHRDEFESIMATNEQRREWLEMKAARAQKPKVATPRSLL